MANAGEKKASASQRLYQVYYLGERAVDRRYSSTVIPWIIEELKLNLERAQDLRRAWLTQGPQRVVFVAEAGEEFVKTNYKNILCCATGQDGVSFGYTAVEERSGKCSCHVFQSLDLDEAELICEQFKIHSVVVNAKHEPSLLSNAAIVTANKNLAKNKKMKVYRTKSASNQQPTNSEDSCPVSFPLLHCGSMSLNHRRVNSELIDCLVAILSASPRNEDSVGTERRARWKMKRKSHTGRTNSMFRDDSMEKDFGDDVGSVEGSRSSPSMPMFHVTAGGVADSGDVVDGEQVSTCSPDRNRRDPPVVSRCASLSLPKSKGGWRSGDSESSGSESPAGYRRSPAIGIPGRSSSSPVWRTSVSVDEVDGGGKKFSNGIAVGGDFDHIPELDELQQTPEFASLSLTDQAPRVRQLLSDSQSAVLTVTELEVVIQTQEEGGKDAQEIIRTRLQLIFSCSQGYSSAEYFGFLTRAKGTTKYVFHLLKTDSKKTASSVIKAFKYGFERCVTAALPNSVCQNCPIYSMNRLCQSLVGLSTSAAHSRVQEFLLSLGENELIRGSKQVELFENDHGQLVRWVGVIRSVVNMKQQEHVHSPSSAKPVAEKGAEVQAPAPAAFDKKKYQERPSSADKARKGRRLLVLRSTLASSLENIRHAKKTDVGDELPVPSADNTSIPLEPPASSAVSSLVYHAADTMNLNSSSPIFSAKKSNRKNSAGSNSTAEGHLHVVQSKGKIVPFDGSAKLYVSNRKRTDSGSPSTSNEDVTASNVDNSKPTPSPMKGHKRTMSLRQQIFESVVMDEDSLLGRATPLAMGVMPPSSRPRPHSFSAQNSIQEMPVGDEQLTPAGRARMRWKWAIEQQLLLQKIEKQNQSVIDASIAAIQRQKMDYRNPDFNQEEAKRLWESLLSKASPSDEQLVSAVKKGIPPMLRGQAWQVLISRYAAKYGPFHQRCPSDAEFTSDLMQQLLEEPSEMDHIIKADISRTYPTHPYFVGTNGPGQTALYEVLNAYSNLDKEVGYCQGLGFIAGHFIMHCDDTLSALKIMCHYMYYYEMRKLYRSSMDELKIRIYQFTRLLHDRQPNLHAHLFKHEVVPMLFATSWFLTLFSSKYPIPFVSRVFDFFFLEGIQAVFKVSLALMKHFESEMLAQPDMESLGLFLNKDFHKLSSEQITRVLQSAWQMPDLVAKLETFETEYRVMLELRATFNKNWMDMSDLESRNKALLEQNDELIQQLALCRGAIMRQEITTSVLQRLVDKQQDRLERFEAELVKERKERLEDRLKNEERWKKLRRSRKSNHRLSPSSESLVDVDIDINESSISSENV